MRFSEAKGHEVVSTADAATVGKVSGFVVDAAAGKVVGLRLKKTEGDVDLLAWADVQGFGPDAVTVGSVAALRKAGDAEKHLDVLGRRVLTEHGVELGDVQDVDFDPADGSIVAVHTKQGEVSGARLLGLGSYALVVR